jgi:hypothetical protein
MEMTSSAIIDIWPTFGDEIFLPTLMVVLNLGMVLQMECGFL